MLPWLGSGDGSLWVANGCLLTVVSHGGKQREEGSSLISLLLRALIPFMRSLLS